MKTWLRNSGALKSTKMTYVLATKFIQSCDKIDKAKLAAKLVHQPT